MLLQDQKLRKRLAQLEELASFEEEHDQEHRCRDQVVLGKAERIINDTEGFRRWTTFQKGMICRAVAAACHDGLDVAVGTAQRQ